jgi:hypothetical protein
MPTVTFAAVKAGWQSRKFSLEMANQRVRTVTVLCRGVTAQPSQRRLSKSAPAQHAIGVNTPENDTPTTPRQREAELTH